MTAPNPGPLPTPLPTGSSLSIAVVGLVNGYGYLADHVTGADVANGEMFGGLATFVVPDGTYKFYVDVIEPTTPPAGWVGGGAAPAPIVVAGDTSVEIAHDGTVWQLVPDEPEPPASTVWRPWRDIVNGFAQLDDPLLEGATFASAWAANMATPAILVVPVRRVELRGSSVRWELALQVVVPLQADDDEPLHSLLELCLTALPAGVILGDTIYGQDDRAGASYVVSTTTLNV